VAKAPPDGYTLLLTANLHWISPLFGKSPYDPLKDFAPITMVASSPNILVVHPSLPVKTVKELIALAKARPGMLNYASTGPGSGSHLAGELLKYMAAINMVHVPYKGTGPGVIALLGGQIQIMFSSWPSVAPSMKSGRLRALAVSSGEPSALAPGLPTVAASGLPGYESVQMYAFFAPARIPAAIISRLNQEVVRALNRAEVKEKLLGAWVEPAGSSPEQLSATMKSEMTRMGKVIKDSGLGVD
jgi:tripartite-type tricarboxylate transporter receptor subunit TctC